MPEARRRRFPWWPAVLWMVVIIGLSSIPDAGERLPRFLHFPYSDTLMHAIVYGVFGALLMLAGGRWWLAVLIASAFGALDETFQGLIPGRQPSTADWLADTVGAAFGAFIVTVSTRSGRA
jgi:VanZ family protein